MCTFRSNSYFYFPIFLIAFCPYHIGHFTVVGCRLKPLVSGAHFEGMLVTLCGYCVIALSLVAVHAAVARLRLRRVARMLGELFPDQKKRSAALRKKKYVRKMVGMLSSKDA